LAFDFSRTRCQRRELPSKRNDRFTNEPQKSQVHEVTHLAMLSSIKSSVQR